MARGDDHVEVAIAIQIRGEELGRLVSGHIVVLGGEPSSSIPKQNGYRASVEVGDREIQLAILVEVAGRHGVGGDGLGEIDGGAERAVAIAEQHREILAAAGHQVRSSVSVEIAQRDG